MGSQSVGHDLVTVQQQRDGQRNRELRKRETDVAEIGQRNTEMWRQREIGKQLGGGDGNKGGGRGRTVQPQGEAWRAWGRHPVPAHLRML